MSWGRCREVQKGSGIRQKTVAGVLSIDPRLKRMSYKGDGVLSQR